MVRDNFEGHWLSTHKFHGGADEDQYTVHFVGDHGLYGENSERPDGSLLAMLLSFDETTSTLTGTWRISTAPEGPYGGQRFHGALHLVINEAMDRAEGQWIGHDREMKEVNEGPWWLEKLE